MLIFNRRLYLDQLLNQAYEKEVLNSPDNNYLDSLTRSNLDAFEHPLSRAGTDNGRNILPAQPYNLKTMPTNKAVLALKTDAKLGEGAFWNYKTQEFYWVDIQGKQLHIYNPNTTINRSFSTPSQIGTVVPGAEHEAIIALEDGVYQMNTQTGAISLFAAIEEDIPENRFNDGKCDPAGRLWVGSMGLQEKQPVGKLYMIDSDGRVTPQLTNITVSNGIVWSADQATMYYIDTPTKQIRAFDYEVSTGAISNERIAVEVSTSLGFPDGMAIDIEGMLWVAMWKGSVVARFNPHTGALISKIEVPALNVTACAFGGEKLDTLYITTARVAMTTEERIQFPDAGSIFMALPGVPGVESTFFGG